MDTKTTPVLQTIKPKLGTYKLWFGLVTIIGLGIGVIAFNTPLTQKPTVASISTSQTGQASESVTTGPLTQSLSYAQALAKYKNRIQFGVDCRATPANAVYKAGATILLDNRTSLSRSIVFDNTRYIVAGYGFRIVSVPTARTFFVDCDKMQNVATITVQK